MYTGITTSRAVLFRKLSMRCRTSCSFITQDHGTAFQVHRMHEGRIAVSEHPDFAVRWLGQSQIVGWLTVCLASHLAVTQN
jgi:hypothetical protein